ncbi:hypothetical protein JAAARDRAFT_147014 [Jaapia argillacea MUCL 33604]|uniref:non-specific serine/threonine protein kinase n=1 Tax=Jaapia argillacea MUCL 33604 TaxID=933084 RepID=A0A067QHT8_9AGAM|nr:hypothetical protein JAAARDRAFT_147014 [Jaapia argillacea MUCL 33604]
MSQQAAARGTLQPGQSIAINKYSVTVERYLSQGGFAHVYIVRTAQPVFNTTHHVLKRIAVANDAMLSEVKKEVDIMRILRGHPNIVYLIDAAWHRMANGMYEVFILMEFCQGGGIIDMMNRRLRERLTESEILQIFADACEGVAAMHNLRPPLLHRDLKVENILQSSPTSYKLCDFGSAAPVALKPPSTTAEIRALEADLMRHTTLQYRAPEMVDPFLRRPVDEKSDVWALGVLLYKLCYYTTPFEEHGPLAILNVQYRIPPYPVYSTQMNSLIGSMLREHGGQRPSVFEVLAHVHQLRGTKSRYNYAIPQRQPLSPRGIQSTQSIPSPPNPLDDLVAYRPAPSSQPIKPVGSGIPGAGIQARDKVLEAIAPMRRGRPTAHAAGGDTTTTQTHSNSPPPSPKKLEKSAPAPGGLLGLDMDFGKDEDEAWKSMKSGIPLGVRGHKSGMVKSEPWKAKSSTPGVVDLNMDAWNPPGNDKKVSPPQGFGDGFGDSFGSSFGLSSSSEAAAAAAGSALKPTTTSGIIIPPRPPSATPILSSADRTSRFSSGLGLGIPSGPSLPSRGRSKEGKDAFDGLGLFSSDRAPAPTLAEARKSMTGLGLAVPNGTTSSGGSGNPSRPSSSTAPLHSPSPQPTLKETRDRDRSPALPPPSPSAAWRHTSSLPLAQDMDVEHRFPSLEELDRTFGSPSPGASVSLGSGSSAPPPGTSQFRAGVSATAESTNVALKAPALPSRSNVVVPDGTGTRGGARHRGDLLSAPGASKDKEKVGGGAGFPAHNYDGVRSQQVTGIAMRDSKNRRFGEPEEDKGLLKTPRRPTLSRKHRSSVSIKHTPTRSNFDLIDITSADPTSPLEAVGSFAQQQRDWLTGGDDESSLVPAPSSTPAVPALSTPVLRDSPSKRASVIEKSNLNIRSPQEAVTQANEITPPSPIHTPTPLKPPTYRGRIPSATARRPSPVKTDVRKDTALSDNWSPVAHRDAKIADPSSSSSGSEVGPEDVNGSVAKSREVVKVDDKKRKTRSKGRQSSVHDLVDLWGGGLSQSPVKEKFGAVGDSLALPSGAGTDARFKVRRSPTLSSSKPTPSPEPQPPPTQKDEPVPRDRSPKRPSSRSHRKQPSVVPVVSPTPVPAPSPAPGRSRPHSMFIFPTSKTSAEPSGNKPISSAAGLGLAPPDNPKVRPSHRRTSISNMVQRFESIGGNVTGQGPTVSPMVPPVKPAGLKVATQDTTGTGSANTRFYRVSPTRISTTGTGTGATSAMPPPKESAYVSEMQRNFLSGATPSRPATSNELPLNPAKPEQVLSDNAPPTRTSAFPQSEAAVTETVRTPTFPERKPTLAPPEDPILRSPSPERPYQGVGKLIDQWQRRTAEPERASSSASQQAKRGGLPARRTGMVGSGKGQ